MEDKNSIEMTAPAVSSIEVGDTAKGLQLKSVKVYYTDPKEAYKQIEDTLKWFDGVKNSKSEPVVE